MKGASVIVVLLLASSTLLAPFACVTQRAGALDLTPVPVLIHSSTSVTEAIDVVSSAEGMIYAVWSERVGEGTDIFVSHSSNNGTTFSDKARVNSLEAGIQRASQAAVAGGKLYISWEDESADGGDPMLSISSDGGESFQETHVSSTEAGTQSNPTLAASGSDVAVAWEEYRSDNTIRIWNGVNGAKLRELAGHSGAVRSVEFSPNGTYLASASEDSTVRIWNAATGALFRNMTTHNAEAMAVNWSADGKMLASGSFDHNVTLYNTTDFSIITKLNSTGGVLTLNNVNAISFSPDSSRMAVAYHGQYGTASQPTGYPTLNFNVTVWNLTDLSSWTRNEASALGPNRSHTDSVLDVSFSHNGTWVATGGRGDVYGNTLKVWDSATGALVRDVPLSWSVRSVSWSPDDRFIAAGLQNGSVAIVNVSDVTDIGWPQGLHTGRVNAVDWGGSMGELVSGASDPLVKLRNPNFAVRDELGGHMNSVYSVDWSSGDLIATAGGNSEFYGMGENQVFCAVSHDGGASFGKPVMASDSCASNRLRPKAAMDGSGVISVVWYDSRMGGTNIYFANSTDGGASFGTNLALTTDSSDNVIPAVFAEASGKVHVVWQFGNGAGVKYANSTDGFAHAREVAQTAQMPEVAGSPDGGSIIVSWRERNSTEMRNYLRMAASYDGGASFPDAAVLNSSASFLGEHVVYVDGYNQTFAAWEANEAPFENMYFRSTVQGDEWGPRVKSSSPFDGESGVSIYTSFTVTFSEPMDRVSVEAAFSWTDGARTWDVGNCTDNSGYWYDDVGGYGDKVTFTPEREDRLRYSKTGYSFTIAGTAKDLAGNIMGSDYVAHFTTSADTDPPVIEHYPSQTTVSYDQAYGVVAVITDQWGNVSSAKLHYQGVSDSTVSRSIDMAPGSLGMYRADIPPQNELGTIYYYISAEDAFGNEAWDPANYTNHSQLYSVAVIDGVKPLIIHDPVQDEDVFADIGIWAVVTDAVQLQEVRLNYKPIGAAGFTSVEMLPDAGGAADAYSHTIPAESAIGQVQYNITALDGSGNFNSTPTLTIQIIDRTAPMINRVAPEHLENETLVRITANITDDVEVDTVTLYFKAVGGDQWVSREMEHVSGDVYEYTIPAQRRSGTIYYYVNATDTSGNLASTLTEQDQFQVDVVGVSEDYSVYYILGGVLVVLMLVLVYLVVRKYTGGGRAGASGPGDEAEAVAGEQDGAGDGEAPEKVDDGR